MSSSVSVCPARLVNKAFVWNIQSNIYEVCHHTACATANFQLKYLILKASAIEAWYSWSRNNVASFHHAVLCWSCLSILSLTMLLLFGWQWATPGLQRYIEVSQNLSSIETSEWNQPISTNLFKNAAFVVDMMENVCCHHRSTAKASNTTTAYSLSLF